MVGELGTILKTTDGGMSWEDQLDDTTVHLYSVFSLDGENGWIAGGDNTGNGIVLQTTDAGDTWTNIANPELPFFTVMHMLNGQTGWAVTGAGDVYKTTDGGAEWMFKFPDPPLSTQIKDIMRPQNKKGCFLLVQGELVGGAGIVSSRAKKCPTGIRED